MKTFISVVSFSLLVISLTTPFVSLAQTAQVPQTMGEAQTMGLGILSKLPEAIKNVWQNQALPIWSNMWLWTKNIWQSGTGEQVSGFWDKVLSWVGLEKPDLKQEFQRKTQETQKDFWTRIMDLINGNTSK